MRTQAIQLQIPPGAATGAATSPTVCPPCPPTPGADGVGRPLLFLVDWPHLCVAGGGLALAPSGSFSALFGF